MQDLGFRTGYRILQWKNKITSFSVSDLNISTDPEFFVLTKVSLLGVIFLCVAVSLQAFQFFIKTVGLI